MKRMKRILILCLVLAMCAGMTVPAFAADINQATAFVTQLYQGLLGRAPDMSGQALFVNKLINGGQSGAVVAEDIATSAEFRARQLTNEEYVTVIFNGLLGHDPTAAEMAYYTNALATGYTRTWLFQQVIASLEFVQVCLNYGLYVGKINTSTTVNTTPTVVNTTLVSGYVNRLYTHLLGRDPALDPVGVADWSAKLTNREMSAAGVAAALASSAEFAARSLTNGEYLQILYRALLGREVDGNGWTTWMTAMNNGKSRGWVLSSICASNEFKNQFGEMNVAAGTVNAGTTKVSGTAVDQTVAGNFVRRAYLNFLGRNPTTIEEYRWVQILVNRQMSAAGVAASIASSDEARARDVTRADFLNAVYWTLLDRGSDILGDDTFLTAMANGYSRSWVFCKVCSSNEFQSRSEYSEMNVVPGYLNFKNYNMG